MAWVLMLLMLERIIRSVNNGGKMYRNLYESERYWMEKLLEAEFKEKEILIEQILKAKVAFEQGYEFISLKFKVEASTKYPHTVRVPVVMRVFQKNVTPIIFLLHVINGYIDELEIIAADLSKIELSTIELDKVEYEIDEEVEIH